MENRTFSNSSRDGFMRVLNYNTLNGGQLNRYPYLSANNSTQIADLR